MQIIEQAGAQSAYEMVKNERMAGFVPSYHGASGEVSDEGFSFFDLVDMVNPLQHVPVLNLAYRALTGDTIKPISQVIGGAVFAGPIGAVGGLVNALVAEEAGTDIAGLAHRFVFKDRPAPPGLVAEEKIAYEDLPVALLSFAQVPLSRI